MAESLDLHDQESQSIPAGGRFDRKCSSFNQQIASMNSCGSNSGKKTKIIAISPSKKMLENSNSKNKFSNLEGLSFLKTRPVFLGMGTVKDLSRKQTAARSRQQSSDSCLNAQPVTKLVSYSQERLESKESREAIYETHGIMNSNNRKSTQL